MTLVGAGLSAINHSEAGANSAEWQEYNGKVNYYNAQANIKSETAITEANASTLATVTGYQNRSIMADADTNIAILQATTLYNDSLLDDELALVWEQAGLDIKLLADQRSRERGTIVANQAGSGTMIGEGSNADVLIDQKTQENLDAFVIQYGADIRAGQIIDTKNKNLWEGEMAIKKLSWESEKATQLNSTNAQIQIESMAAQQNIKNISSNITASSAKTAASAGAAQTISNANMQASNTLVGGLFGAASSAVTEYYANKPTGSSGAGTGSGTSSINRSSVSLGSSLLTS